ncbi:hypothetical protein [Jeotgalibacillus sp. JSM ZJ347]|uniref:hypothetical protein n=1 Tax=Jeotgalibacillus sp. JSM ZJ347 TaxID=3342117 RepID=UPI0035A8AC5E
MAHLLLSIVFATILGFLLMMAGPFIGGLLAFGIVVGTLFRGVYLLNDIHKKGSVYSSGVDKVQAAYEKHLKENSAQK